MLGTVTEAADWSGVLAACPQTDERGWQFGQPRRKAARRENQDHAR
jgi:hypothetical protein